MDDRLAAMRTCPRTPDEKSRISSARPPAWCNSARACRANASPALVGSTPRAWRLNRITSKVRSSSDNRLLSADGAMCSRAAAAAILPSSSTATKT
ncbi:hypothetical protein D3C78_1576030 [compost metagenome]